MLPPDPEHHPGDALGVQHGGEADQVVPDAARQGPALLQDRDERRERTRTGGEPPQQRGQVAAHAVQQSGLGQGSQVVGAVEVVRARAEARVWGGRPARVRCRP
ncbi:MAG: hypothetical protein QN158_12870 [Armatimonadota bacterium]|nr:hypothetical protein [Armatimonadota bacterium]MDR7488381.1 hypothetical protein [Armatimonadota bacterium]MDR7502412.1 hypothetical protein [Armatimonadota bacterium]MDR7528698.1 hypothetical protein [Armatimonadota bacterium]MDR7586460.1 hypothetical protein [Armatimonadota bacterium]